MDMYVRMYDELKRTQGDNPTIGILLCAETSEDIAAGGKSGARHDLVSNLHFADIGEKLFLVKFNIGIAVARFLVFREKRPLGNLADIAAIVRHPRGRG